MAVYKTYEQVGLKEDVSSLISDITPSDCPFYSMIKTEKVHNRVYQYQTDTIAAAGLERAARRFHRIRRYGHSDHDDFGNTQILTKVFEVSESAQASSAHGRARDSLSALESPARNKT